MDMTEYIEKELNNNIFKTNIYDIANREDIVFIYIEDSSKFNKLKEQLLINNIQSNLTKEYKRYETEYPFYMRAVCNIDILEREARIDMYAYDNSFYKQFSKISNKPKHIVYSVEEMLETWI